MSMPAAAWINRGSWVRPSLDAFKSPWTAQAASHIKPAENAAAIHSVRSDTRQSARHDRTAATTVAGTMSPLVNATARNASTLAWIDSKIVERSEQIR